jgi:hypothetical protein
MTQAAGDVICERLNNLLNYGYMVYRLDPPPRGAPYGCIVLVYPGSLAHMDFSLHLRPTGEAVLLRCPWNNDDPVIIDANDEQGFRHLLHRLPRMTWWQQHVRVLPGWWELAIQCALVAGAASAVVGAWYLLRT